jgi:HD-GYP domain-containing protein (c-di-GMP phosphodiesterase class II)
MTSLLNQHLYENFNYAYIADKNLRILHHTNPEMKGKILGGQAYSNLHFGEDVKSNIISTGNFYEMVIPVIKDFKVVGTVHIGIEDDVVDSRVRDMITQNTVILFVSVLLFLFLLYYLLAKNITRPIGELVGKVEQISDEFNLMLHKNKREVGDELKEFSLMFDTMAGEIREKTNKLEDSNKQLQADIKQRKIAEKKLKESYKELGIAFDGSIMAIAIAIESRDPYTAGHQQRVSQLACMIAKELRLSESKIKEIHLSAMSHDIGKIGIPISILTKKGKLTDREYETIKAHSQVGYDILKEIKFPWPIATIVRQHHERLDGSGYPLGIKEDEILFESKIIAISDVVEAIVSARPYRKALGKDVAMEEILKFKNIKYDSTIVDICLDLFLKKNFKFTNKRKNEMNPSGTDNGKK